MTNTSNAVNFEVSISGTKLEATDVMTITVDDDLWQPSMCLVTLKNPTNKFNEKFKPGDTIEVKIGGGTRRSDDGSGDGGPATIFKGEVVGVEASYKQGGEPKLSVRGFNKLHRLLRGRKSKTYQDQSDQDIASAIAGQHGLSAQCGSTPKITHKHVYQHNQTDLEFLRVRAARLGFAIWVEDTKMFFDAPKLDADSGLEFAHEQQPKSGEGDKLKSFHGRLSNAQVVKKVTVRGWDPEKKEEIVGEESAASSPLGSKNAASSLSDFGEVVTFCVDYPIASVEEAKAIAKAKLKEASLSYLTAEAVCMGNNKVKAGIVVKIKVNADKADDRFNGKYLVNGVTHRYSADNKGSEGGYESIMRLARDAEKGS
ncbi:MAG: phage late control D family protein [Myxococcales bacterium]|nr:phage late control D family protein [Myxococcales bacterium]